MQQNNSQSIFLQVYAQEIVPRLVEKVYVGPLVIPGVTKPLSDLQSHNRTSWGLLITNRWLMTTRGLALWLTLQRRSYHPAGVSSKAGCVSIRNLQAFAQRITFRTFSREMSSRGAGTRSVCPQTPLIFQMPACSVSLSGQPRLMQRAQGRKQGKEEESRKRVRRQKEMWTRDVGIESKLIVQPWFSECFVRARTCANCISFNSYSNRYYCYLQLIAEETYSPRV